MGKTFAKSRTFATCVALVLSTQIAGAASLADNKRINDGLIAVGVADEIRKRCPDISARLVRAVSFIKSLERHARSQGFSEAEIKAYTKNDEQKAILKGKARAWLAERGATSDPDAYCKVGQEEIAKSSPIGALLKAN